MRLRELLAKSFVFAHVSAQIAGGAATIASIGTSPSTISPAILPPDQKTSPSSVIRPSDATASLRPEPSTAAPKSTTSRSANGPGARPQPVPTPLQNEAASQTPAEAAEPATPFQRCKTVVGDVNWPAYDVWKSSLPRAVPVAVIGRDAHPNYFLAARSVEEVRAAVFFVRKYNIRLAIISSGYDYLGR
jgi:hypothetical protein